MSSTKRRLLTASGAEINVSKPQERAKYHLTQAQINRVLKAVIIDGLNLDRTSAEGVDFPYPRDIVFYEVALSKEDSCLVGRKHQALPRQAIRRDAGRNGQDDWIVHSSPDYLEQPP